MFKIEETPKMFSIEFYDYNTRDYKKGFGPWLKAGDVIEACEFNQTTQIYDVKVK